MTVVKLLFEQNIKCAWFYVLIALLVSCKTDFPVPTDVIKKYIHLSHTRTDSNPGLAQHVESIPFENYDMIWLGGDLTFLTSEDTSTLLYVDQVFDLTNPNVLWALGNHDYSNLNLITSITNRPNFYAYSKNNICFIVLDTQDSLSNIVNEQLALFDQVIDTIQESSHLIILHHKLIWMYGDPYLESQVSSVSNAEIDSCFFCINPNNFYTTIYPKLLTVLNRGIQVLCIGGDLGINTNEFEYITQEGIYFLASGVDHNSTSNKALIFEHNINKNELSWKYEELSSL